MNENDPLGGVWTIRMLTDAGWGRSEILDAVSTGQLVRLRRGWYASPDADPKATRAVRQRGALACVSALEAHGVWVPEHSALHIRRSHNETGPLPSGVQECRPCRRAASPDKAVDDVLMALSSAWRCLSHEDFVAVVDSVVHHKLATIRDVTTAFDGNEGAGEALSKHAAAESGTETYVRLRLRRRGLAVRSQVQIGQDRVDLLVGERLVVEVDSRAHHTGEENYAKDRARDLRLRALGYVVVRLTYAQVVHEWPQTEAAIVAMTRHGDHLWGSRRGRRPAPDKRVPRRRPRARATGHSTGDRCHGGSGVPSGV